MISNKFFLSKSGLICKKFILFVMVLSCLLSFTACGGNVNWEDMILGDMLPVPPSSKGEVHYNKMEELWVVISKVSDKDFADYVLQCKEFGFVVDAQLESSSFYAYNSEGYNLRLSHYSVKEELTIDLEAPMEFNVFIWPTSNAGKMLPVPESDLGNFSYEYEDSFFLYVGNTSKLDYQEYVIACSEKGFTVNYDKGDDYYYAENSDGWYLSLCYEGNNIMSISIDAPQEEQDTVVVTEVIAEVPETEMPTQVKENDNDSNGGLSSDFMNAMDSYETFMDEYVEFIKEYNDNPSDLGLLVDYAEYMSKYAKFVADFEKWSNEDLSEAELDYYIEVQTRVNQKLLELY